MIENAVIKGAARDESSSDAEGIRCLSQMGVGGGGNNVWRSGNAAAEFFIWISILLKY